MSEVSTDEDGTLFDPRVRESMAVLTDGDTLTFEAAAAVRTAFHAVERLRSRGTSNRGLSSGALDILIRLSTAPDGMAPNALAQAAGVSARNVTGLLDTLQRDGLIERSPDPHDRRSIRATITAAGQEWLDAFRTPSQLAMAAVFRGFSPAELTQLRHLCLRLADNTGRIQ
ncbi:MAG: MarR family transcriptional regulator [Kibdelosporangium sp.]